MTSPSPPKPHNTHPSLDRFSVIREWDIDLLLLEELNCCPDFSAWLYETIRRRVSRVSLPVIRPTMCVARHSVNYVGDGSGESDIEAFFRSGQGSQLPEALLLIEDKINAQFTEGQPERYAARCREIATNQGCVAATILIAPSGYLAATSSAAFDASVSYEEIVEQMSRDRSVDAREVRSRQTHRILMLRHAIEKHRRGGIRIVDDSRTDFFSEYEAALARRQPMLRSKPNRGRTAESRGYFFDVYPRLQSTIRQLNMMHALDKGIVFLQFRGWGDDRDYFLPLFRNSITDHRMMVDAPADRNYVEVSIRSLPRLKLGKPLGEQIDAAHAAMDAAAIILKWYQANVAKLDAWSANRPVEK